MHDEIYKQIGNNIKKVRKSKNLTQEQLAVLIGKGLNFVGKIEVGFSHPSLNTIIDIAKALDIDLKDLFEMK